MSTANDDIIYTLAQVKTEAVLNETAFRQRLTDYINHLIINDFSALVNLLYRIDVHESKLKYLLNEHSNEDAASIISALMIERQLEKIKSRATFRQSADDGEERW